MSANIRGILTSFVVLCASVAEAGPMGVGGGREATATMTADGVPYDVPLIHRPGPPPGRGGGPPFDPPGPPFDPPGPPGPPFDPPGPPDEPPGHFVVGYVDDLGNEIEGYTINRDGQWQCTISGVLDPDPAIDQAISVTDFGAPSSFSFFFTMPITPIGATNTVNASLVGGLTDATDNGVAIGPTLADMDGDGSPELLVSEVLAPLTNMGVDVGLASSHVGGGSGIPVVHPYGSFSAGPIAGPGPGPWVTLNATLAFSLSGGGDTAALTLHSEIVPEPSTVALAGIGAVLLLGYAARRRRAR